MLENNNENIIFSTIKIKIIPSEFHVNHNKSNKQKDIEIIENEFDFHKIGKDLEQIQEEEHQYKINHNNKIIYT